MSHRESLLMPENDRSALKHTSTTSGVAPTPSTARSAGVESLEQLHAAALRGDPGAQCAMGHRYLHGDGVKADSAEAVRWYRLASAQGWAEADGTLGFCFEYGIGVAKDDVLAAECYRRAAERRSQT